MSKKHNLQLLTIKENQEKFNKGSSLQDAISFLNENGLKI